MLTPYIESGSQAKGQFLSRVKNPLLGIEPGQMVDSYSGFITANKESKRHSFFWFFPAIVRLRLFF